VDKDFLRFIRRSGFLAEGEVFALRWASAGTALMAVVCAVRRKLAYESTAQTDDIKTRRVCPPQGVFLVFVFPIKNPCDFEHPMGKTTLLHHFSTAPRASI